MLFFYIEAYRYSRYYISREGEQDILAVVPGLLVACLAPGLQDDLEGLGQGGDSRGVVLWWGPTLHLRQNAVVLHQA